MVKIVSTEKLGVLLIFALNVVTISHFIQTGSIHILTACGNWTFLPLLVCKCSQFTIALLSRQSRGSAIGIATGYELDDGWVGVRVPVGTRLFTPTYRPDPAL
jgi:hypothetical protein